MRVRRFFNRWSRKLHRWGAIAAALPFAIIIATGLVLQLKKDVAWVQPPTARGVAPMAEGAPAIAFDAILAAVRSVPEAAVQTWDDVDRLDVRPDRGIVKVQARSRWEVQVDIVTGEIVQVAYRRSDLIESIHDGSWFHDKAKLWIFLPAAAVVAGLWLTGMYLWALPIVMKRRGRIRRAAAAARREADE
jgi:uncharacterized iron-regulated membrane protein